MFEFDLEDSGESSRSYFTRSVARSLGLHQRGDDQHQGFSHIGDESGMSMDSSDGDSENGSANSGAAAVAST